MEDRMTNAVKRWLETIMPAVVDTLVAGLSEDVLRDMGKEQGIHGPITVGLEEFNAPVTAVRFYVSVVDDSMVLATDATVRGVSEDSMPELEFDMAFPIADFAERIADEGQVRKLVSRVLEIYKAVA